MEENAAIKKMQRTSFCKQVARRTVQTGLCGIHSAPKHEKYIEVPVFVYVKKCNHAAKYCTCLQPKTKVCSNILYTSLHNLAIWSAHWRIDTEQCVALVLCSLCRRVCWGAIHSLTFMATSPKRSFWILKWDAMQRATSTFFSRVLIPLLKTLSRRNASAT